MTRRGWIAIAAALTAMTLIVAGGAWLARDVIGRLVHGPDPEVVASASLEGLREQNRLSAFAARFVAVVTSRQSRFGLTAERTLILPGSVRYEVDLAKLAQNDVRWNAARHELRVRLPDVEVVGPQVELNSMRQYDNGGVLMKLTDIGGELDAANRKAAQAELMRQARAPVPMRLAREATRRAIERSFAMPLRAAGIEGKVVVRFAGEPEGGQDEQWDRSRSIEQVFGNQQ